MGQGRSGCLHVAVRTPLCPSCLPCSRLYCCPNSTSEPAEFSISTYLSCSILASPHPHILTYIPWQELAFKLHGGHKTRGWNYQACIPLLARSDLVNSIQAACSKYIDFEAVNAHTTVPSTPRGLLQLLQQCSSEPWTKTRRPRHL